MKKLLSIIICILLPYTSLAFSIIRDDETESILNTLSNPVFKVAGLDASAVSIFIVNDETPNAFVFGGQNIFITTGLIKFSNNPDTIVGVIAHETGHIVGGHLVYGAQEMRNLQKKMALSLLAAAIAGLATQSSDAAIGTISASQTSLMNSFMSFNRSQESAADNAAIKYMSKLGVDSSGIVSFLQKLNTDERTFYSDISPYNRTHPLSKERIDIIEQKMKQSKGQARSYITEEMRQKFARVYTKISAFTDNPNEVLAAYKNTNINSKYASSIAYYRLGNKALAISTLDEAMAQETSNPYFNELKGQILFESGDTVQAIKYYEIATKIKPNSDLLRTEYANVLISNNTNIQLSIKMLEMVIANDPSDIQAWNLLAKAYDLNKNKADSQIAIAYGAYLSGDEATAKKYVATIKQYRGMNQNQLTRFTQLKDLVATMRDEVDE
ncbi:MAG: M48 family metalloprotease [Alphaproteobacteria bacterium]|jgi:predicted Zn-dependent protease|nr:M48 family metalloprotease [Candidatus Jidaibacter sp.]